MNCISTPHLSELPPFLQRSALGYMFLGPGEITSTSVSCNSKSWVSWVSFRQNHPWTAIDRLRCLITYGEFGSQMIWLLYSWFRVVGSLFYQLFIVLLLYPSYFPFFISQNPLLHPCTIVTSNCLYYQANWMSLLLVNNKVDYNILILIKFGHNPKGL